MSQSRSALGAQLRRFPRVLGGLLVAPARALREIEAVEKGGFFLLVGWCLAAAITLRFVNLADAFAGLDAGGGMRVVSVVVGELTEAVPVALVAALVIVVGAGGKREPSVDLELGCAAAVPFMVTRALFRAGVIISEREPPHRWAQASYLVAGAWAGVLTLLALRIARGRPVGRLAEPATPAVLRRGLVAGWAALAVLVAGLAGGVVWTAGNAGTLGPVSRGAPAPDFTLPRIDGKPGAIALSSLRGKVVVLDFWATWCPPCLAMLPTMHQLSAELGSQGVTFLGVDSDGPQTTPDEVARFLVEHGAPYPVVYDEGTANELYRVKALPTIVLVTKDGRIARVVTGLTSKGTLKKAIEATLAL
ncbi:MAG TPA: TlpA disulfide reductase family protein [Polyangia bacterium]